MRESRCECVRLDVEIELSELALAVSQWCMQGKCYGRTKWITGLMCSAATERTYSRYLGEMAALKWDAAK